VTSLAAGVAVIVPILQQVQTDWGVALEAVSRTAQLVADITGSLADIASNIDTVWDKGMINVPLLAQVMRQFNRAAGMIQGGGLPAGTTGEEPTESEIQQATGGKITLEIVLKNEKGETLQTLTEELDSAHTIDVNLGQLEAAL